MTEQTNNQPVQPLPTPDLSPSVHFALAVLQTRTQDMFNSGNSVVKAADDVIRVLINENQTLKQRIKELENNT